MTFDHEKELIHMWQETTAPGPLDAGELRRRIAARVAKFDRKIRWRNIRAARLQSSSGQSISSNLFWSRSSLRSSCPSAR